MNSDYNYYQQLLYKSSLGCKNKYFLYEIEKLHKNDEFEALYLNGDKVVSISNIPNGEFNIDEGNHFCYSSEEVLRQR